MEAAATTPGLWDRLVAGIMPTVTKDECAAKHVALYRSLTAGQRAPSAAAQHV
jgi:hypothetical protein